MKESDIRPHDLFNRYLALSREDVEYFFSDHSGFVPVACPACGCDGQAPGLVKFGFTYVLCTKCSTLYVSPRPTPQALNDYYREAKSVRFWSTNFYRETAEARREKMFRPRALLVSQLRARLGAGAPATFLDIGSGFGIFLEEVRRLGEFAEVLGIEPNPEMAEICRERGFRIVQKPLESVEAGEAAADFAAAFEVLEHVFDPLEFLQSAHRVLKPGALFLFTTLTVSGFDIQVLWEHSKSVYPPHHINLISLTGMERLVERAGLKLLELTTPGELDVDIVANMLRDDPMLPVPRFVHHLLKNCDAGTHREFQRFLSGNRLSSHVRVVAAAPCRTRRQAPADSRPKEVQVSCLQPGHPDA